ncbi:MAG: hypothetical protein GY953_25550, partial [bacterium]|nr:hypothetical protein [bacterium]
RPPKATFQSDQYAVAALIYSLLTGEHTFDFSAEKQEMLRQIAETPAAAFSRRGLPPRPRLEAVLARALSKHPEDRWPSVREFVARFSEAATAELAEGSTAGGTSPALRGQMSRFLDQVLGRLGTTAPLLSEGLPWGPLCSVNYGAAGVACALYRIAQTRDDPALLAQADLWATRGYSDRSREHAFHHEELGLTEKEVGRVSPYHNVSGLYAVQALIAHAMADHVSQQAAIDR